MPEFPFLRPAAALVLIGAFAMPRLGRARPGTDLIPAAGWSFPLGDKTLVMGMPLADARVLVPSGHEEKDSGPTDKKVAQTTLVDDGADGVTRLIFRDGRLHEARLEGGTEGPTAMQEAFESWLVKTYGKGSRTKRGARWLVKGVTVTKSCWYDKDSGDGGCGYTIKGRM